MTDARKGQSGGNIPPRHGGYRPTGNAARSPGQMKSKTVAKPPAGGGGGSAKKGRS